MIVDCWKNKSYREIAKEVGVYQSVVFRALTENARNVSLPVFLKIAKSIGAPKDDAINEWVDSKQEVLEKAGERYEALRPGKGDRAKTRYRMASGGKKRGR